MIRIPREQLREVPVAERLKVQPLDDLLVSKEVWPETTIKCCPPREGPLFEKQGHEYFEQLWKRKAIETQQEILELQLARSNQQQIELTKTLQNIAFSLQPPTPSTTEAPSSPERDKAAEVEMSRKLREDIISGVSGDLAATRDDFAKGLDTLAKSISRQVESCSTGNQKEMEETLEAYMSRMHDEFRLMRQEVRLRPGRSPPGWAAAPPTPLTRATCTFANGVPDATSTTSITPMTSIEAFLDAPKSNFYDQIRQQMDQFHEEVSSITWSADISKKTSRPKLQNMQGAPVVKKKTDPYSGKKIAVPSGGGLYPTQTHEVVMSTQKPTHLKDSGRKLLELPDKARPPLRSKPAPRFPRPRGLQPQSIYHPSTQPHAPHHSARSAQDERALSTRSSPRVSPSREFSARQQHHPSSSSTARLIPGHGRVGYGSHLAAPAADSAGLPRGPRISASHFGGAGHPRAERSPPPICRPREVCDLQLLLPPSDLFQLPINDDDEEEEEEIHTHATAVSRSHGVKTPDRGTRLKTTPLVSPTSSYAPQEHNGAYKKKHNGVLSSVMALSSTTSQKREMSGEAQTREDGERDDEVRKTNEMLSEILKRCLPTPAGGREKKQEPLLWAERGGKDVKQRSIRTQMESEGREKGEKEEEAGRERRIEEEATCGDTLPITHPVDTSAVQPGTNQEVSEGREKEDQGHIIIHPPASAPAPLEPTNRSGVLASSSSPPADLVAPPPMPVNIIPSYIIPEPVVIGVPVEPPLLARVISVPTAVTVVERTKHKERLENAPRHQRSFETAESKSVEKKDTDGERCGPLKKRKNNNSNEEKEEEQQLAPAGDNYNNDTVEDEETHLEEAEQKVARTTQTVRTAPSSHEEHTYGAAVSGGNGLESLTHSALLSRTTRFEGLMLLGPTRSVLPDACSLMGSFPEEDSMMSECVSSSLGEVRGVSSKDDGNDMRYYHSAGRIPQRNDDCNLSEGECLLSVGEIPPDHEYFFCRSEGEIPSECECGPSEGEMASECDVSSSVGN